MEYTVRKLGKLAGISERTLRYYDEIGILKPARISSSGYRIYGLIEVDKLQQILFYRELGVSLEGIRDILSDKNFDRIKALLEHREKLLDKRKQLDLLIVNVNNTIEQSKGSNIMSDKDKFEGFKQKMINDNEQKYGKEIREKYGDRAIDESNKEFGNMSKEQYTEFEKLGNTILATLKEAFIVGDPKSELAQRAAQLHGQWITTAWGKYSKEGHAGVAQMYVDDERFTAYYDKDQPGMAKFLRDAIFIYTGTNLDPN